ncbi:MAG: hypothetical protein JJT75_00665 [Opitutales bacterium]|nr:hypothetical protein [Opitutales bacterium]
MIALYSLFFVLGIIGFACLSKFGLGKRFIIAFLIFAVPSIIMTVALVVTGDKPTPGARTITPEELKREGDDINGDN